MRPLAVWYAAEILTGIALVHWSEGWFVVGAAAGGGIEYSVLIVACLAAVFLADRAALRVGGDALDTGR